MWFPNSNFSGFDQFVRRSVERGAFCMGFVGGTNASPIGVVAPLIDRHDLDVGRNVIGRGRDGAAFIDRRLKRPQCYRGRLR